MDTHYSERESGELHSKLFQFLEDAWTVRKVLEPFKPNPGKVNAILNSLQAGVFQGRDKQPPFWLEPRQDEDAAGLIACRNGMLRITGRALSLHTPHLFNVNCLPFDYDPDAPPPKEWNRFLRDLWPDDEDGKRARLTLQELFGLMLVDETRYQKIFMIVGPRRSGKGTIGRVLTALLGKENVANPTLAGLSTNFGLWPLIDKRAAIISDARLGPQTNAHTVAERLLSISGEDSLTVDRKYQPPWTGRFGARFMILTNELPRIADASGALASRFVILTLQRSFYDQEDLALTAKLLQELPGILNWSLAGLDRLSKRGYFKMPISSLEAVRQLESLASPVQAFISEWCTVGAGQRITVKNLYGAFRAWGESDGIKPDSNIVFGRNLRALLPQVRARDKGEHRFYDGIALSRQGQENYEEAQQKPGRYPTW
jgi:putative DNA primase/helicase